MKTHRMSDELRIRPGRRYRVQRDPNVAVAKARSVESLLLQRLLRSTIVVAFVLLDLVGIHNFQTPSLLDMGGGA